MDTQSTLTKQMRGLGIGLVLSTIPILVLFATLIRSGYMGVAWKSLQGKYQIHGVPSNPWLSFAPLFCLPMIAFMVLFWSSIALLSRSQLTVLRIAGAVLLALSASAAYGASMVSASISYLWFRDTPVVGTVSSSVFLWFSAFIPLIALGANCYGLIAKETSP